jgi:hypothetical protein
MAEKVNITVDKDIAKAVEIIQALRDCGIIDVTSEMKGMDGIWCRLDESDKRFIAGMIKGSASVMADQK